ncbi:hypothetical protein Ahy_A09g044302 [Arachis hypogaea]|uniref:Uncharacterized protein n=1 Tax=Arachis hypogaea TaxID=3818 RepID=A0A445BJT9_ARAHY|nr:hypothetical protein Ahy_A09g044302 [Arachis hypogaea]
MYGTRLLINPDVSGAVMLRKSVYYREISQYLSVLSGKPAYVNEDEVLYSIERKTIKELRVAANVGFYVILATVLDVEPVLNGTAITTFVVFDKEAAALFGRTYTEMGKELLKILFINVNTIKHGCGLKKGLLNSNSHPNQRKIKRPLLSVPPDELIQLHTRGDQRRHLIQCFVLHQWPKKIDRGVNNGIAPPIFKPGVKTTIALVAYFLRIVCDQQLPSYISMTGKMRLIIR